ncbi:MAG: helix-turn-helix domain-containing protein [Tolypothrix sp. T3-bin4]|nr:helix-turn-helix domain-containing protein [Tolypothrix sp. T3-bin4]
MIVDEQSQFLTSFQRKLLLKHIKNERRSEYRRRIEIMLLADAGKSQAQVCEELGCSQKTARQWIGMASKGKAHLWHESPIGRPHTVNDGYLKRLRELVSHNPRDYGYPFKQWTAGWLSKHLKDETGIEISDRHINRLLKEMGLSTRSTHAKEVTNQGDSQDKELKIALYDLQPAASSESSDLLLINLLEVRP